MKARASLHSRAEQYLAERRGLGYSLRTPACSVLSFARHLQALGHRGPLTVDVMTEWARRDSHGSRDPNTWARRLKHLRSFARWMRQFDPLTEIPDHTIFGRIDERQAPHIYSETEIIDLLAAARRLGPATQPRGLIFATLFGLLASCGLRIGEALALRNADVDLSRGMLLIRKAKFGKSRQVPMHSSTTQALLLYRQAMDWAGKSSAPEAPFFIGTRGRRDGTALGDRQVHRVFDELREQLAWCNRGNHHAPRIHDLRHTFVVRRIAQWQAQGADVDQAILALSTYVGHAEVGNTYWYLSAAPELMAVAGLRFASFASQMEASHA
ncbi:MAG: tyrosine-type recombinase/integrase [Rubrivivax sp.]|jgi:integrase